MAFAKSKQFYIPRIIEKKLLDSIESQTITMITGARQVGKSTLMEKIQQYVQEKFSVIDNMGGIQITKNIFAYTLDDIQLRSALRKDIRYIEKDVNLALGENLHTTHKKVFIFIDEVQKFSDLFDWIKQVFDANSKHIKFVITGSSALGLSKSIGETLAGRVEYMHVYPIAYSELANSRVSIQQLWFIELIKKITGTENNANKQSVGAIKNVKDKAENLTENILSQVEQVVAQNTVDADLSTQKTKEVLSSVYSTAREFDRDLTALVLETMFYGGLPRLYGVQLEERIKLLRNYISVYLEKEIGFIARNLDLELFGLSLQSFAEQNGGPLNINQVSKEVGIARPSLYKYLDLLENTFLIKRVYPYGGGKLKDTSKSLVLYYLDSGILNTLTFVNSIADMLKPDNFKRNMGTFVLENILTQLALLDNPPPIYYWQDYEGHKVDFILEFGQYVFAFMLDKPKDIRKLKATKAKLREIIKQDKVILFITPTFDPQNIDISFEVTHDAGFKNFINIDMPLQLWI